MYLYKNMYVILSDIIVIQSICDYFKNVCIYAYISIYFNFVIHIL